MCVGACRFVLIFIFRVFDTFWDYQQQIDDTIWLRQHLIGTILQEEDCVPGSGAAAMIIDIVNATELECYSASCTGILIGGKMPLKAVLLVTELGMVAFLDICNFLITKECDTA